MTKSAHDVGTRPAAPIESVTLYSAGQIADLGLSGLPATKKGIAKLAEREGWAFEERRGIGGTERAYSLAVLPSSVQEAFVFDGAPSPAAIEGFALGAPSSDAYAAASAQRREQAGIRAQAIHLMTRARIVGWKERDAADRVGARLGCSGRTVFRYLKQSKTCGSADAAALLPKQRGPVPGNLAPIHSAAWDWFLSYYHTDSKPTFELAYRELGKRVSINPDWAPLPSLGALKRRYKREVDLVSKTIRRDGLRAYESMLPTQRRDKSALRALEWVNGDAHKIDLAVMIPMRDGQPPRITRVHLHAWQDVYSGCVLAWELAETENAAAVRRAFARMLECWGIPEHVTVDNGHAWAAKEMTAGSANRKRFGSGADDDFDGLYKSFGITAHFARVAHGQSKPIERAFRSMVADDIARAPECIGAYLGNSPVNKPESYGEKAIPFEALYSICAERIRDWNERQGRRTKIANGRSYQATFDESYSANSERIRRPLQKQLRWLLLPSKVVVVGSREATINIAGNRFFNPALFALRGQKVVVRYRADDIKAGAWVFRPGSLEEICEAACIQDEGWASEDAARRSHRAMRAQMNADKKKAAALGTLRPHELVAEPVTVGIRSMRGKVIAGLFGRGTVPPEPADQSAERRRGEEESIEVSNLFAGQFDRLIANE